MRVNVQGELRGASFFSVLLGELERARQPSVASQWGRGCSGARRFFTSEVAQPSGLRSGSSQRVCGRVFFRACVAPGARRGTRMFGHHRPPLWLFHTQGF